MLCIHGRNDVSKCEKCSILKDSDKMLCIHGRTHNTCGNCIRRKNEKMKRKMINSNRNIKSSNEQIKRKPSKLNSALSNCDNFCEHFESVELCKECLQNTKLHLDPVDFMDNIGMFLNNNYYYYSCYVYSLHL
jgi:hypothetical protein